MTRTATGDRAPRDTPRNGSAPARRGEEAPRLTPRREANRWLRRALVFAICALVLDGVFGERGLAEKRRARAAYEAALTELQTVRAENAGLREQVRRLQHDPAAIEAMARRDLGYIRPGEILVVVRDVKPPALAGR